jgi:cytidine deaminase
MSGMTPQQMVKHAVAAAENSYSPYSKFRVGAALLTDSGNLFCGTNVENASYGLTICAERSAFFTAVTAGYRTFNAIAIVATGDAPPSPCGACRQVMAEFCASDFEIILATIESPTDIQIYTLDDMLPHRFKI